MEVKKSDVDTIGLSKVSPMPEHLVDGLTVRRDFGPDRVLGIAGAEGLSGVPTITGPPYKPEGASEGFRPNLRLRFRLVIGSPRPLPAFPLPAASAYRPLCTNHKLCA